MKILRLLSLAALIAMPATAQVNVPFERICASSKEPGNWLTHHGDYAGHRYSALDQITPTNIASLKTAWIYQSREAGKWEVTPLVVDGVMYLTERPNAITALDCKTGRPLWNYTRPMADAVGCCGPVNRGLAILGDALYMNTFDCHLVCIDANTGKERWDTVVADYRPGYSMTGAPLAVKDKILVGISGGEFGIRGFLDAYDAKTGAHAWRFWTVPAKGEPGNETWGAGNAWTNGATATWATGTYDPALNLVYWGTGNPGPDYNGDTRPGDNLYSCCVVALDPDSGKLRWHFQYTPHDVHDWDSCEIPLLIDANIDGQPRKLLAQANRNAFFYVLDRASGEFITGKAFAKQTWASGLDAKGRPILISGKEPTANGVLVYPGLEGSANWPAPAYSPRTGLFYVQTQDDYSQVYYKHKSDYNPGNNYEGGGARNVLGEEPYGAVKAIEATTGTVKWEFKEQSSSNAGVLATASGLIFSGTHDGYFYALNAATGEPLWRFQTGGTIHGAPVTFLVDGKQYFAIAAGAGLFAFAL
ncbi:MAG TPA: PQQ-dependent dehydrogenase, methanol/ethanol family [Verrucomicrobiae bacterium]|jgi:alcohol dehydrogenase (cytochrome c)|nr:PQQ-dependent dehydrogenase, methanol/ethanol family [Verrucomicrobiae bacterium]